MSNDFNITYEKWLADKMLPMHYFDEEAVDGLLSIHRLIFHKPYREILKEKGYLTKNTYDTIRKAQDEAFNKVEQALLEFRLETINEQQSNLKFLKIRLQNLITRLEKITEKHGELLEAHYSRKIFPTQIWGGAYMQIINNEVPSNFLFSELAKDQIERLGDEPNYIREKKWEWSEWHYIFERAKIVDLNIEILVNEKETELIENIFEEHNFSVKQDERNHITTTGIYHKFHELYDGGKGMKQEAAYKIVEDWLLNELNFTKEEVKEKWNITLEFNAFTRSWRNNRYL